MHFSLSEKIVTIILVIIATIAGIVWIVSGNDPIGYLCYFLLSGGAFGLMGWTYEKAEDKSSIDWSQYSDLRRIRHTILIMQIISYICYVILIGWLCNVEDFTEGVREEDFSIPFLIKWSLFLFPYIIYCRYIFIKGTSNALFHVRALLLVPFLSLLSFALYVLCFIFKNSPSCGSFYSWSLAVFALLYLLLLALFLRLILITCGSNSKKAFPKNERKVDTFDLFFVFLLYCSGFCIYAIDWLPFDRFIYRRVKMEYLEESDVSVNKPNSLAVEFYPKNATIVDSEGSHNFTSYDCPNMNVTDNGNTVGISWGGDNVVLNEIHSNSDTYAATGNTSRGKVTIKAFRSSANGKIYLVTVAMPNPTPDVLHITINFKP